MDTVDLQDLFKDSVRDDYIREARDVQKNWLFARAEYREKMRYKDDHDDDEDESRYWDL